MTCYFTVDDWLDLVDSCVLIDYDGCGEPLSMACPPPRLRGRLPRTRLLLSPSNFNKRTEAVTGNRARLRANFKYVVWYNR